MKFHLCYKWTAGIRNGISLTKLGKKQTNNTLKILPAHEEEKRYYNSIWLWYTQQNLNFRQKN